MRTKHDPKKPLTFRLKGELQTNTIWLNGMRITSAKSQKIHNHSPDGFAWGYNGSGPAQLALAVCVELYGEKAARSIYQTFKVEVIGRLPQRDFDCNLIYVHGQMMKVINAL